MALPETATFSQFAAILGCKPGWVTALRKADRLVLTDDGKAVRVAESMARVEATKDQAKAVVAQRHAEARGNSLAEAPVPAVGEEKGAALPADEDDEPAPTTGYQHWRERREKAAALTAERELALAEKRLLDAPAVEAALTAVVTALRTGLEQLPYELAPQLAPLSDESAIQALLVDAIEEKLRELSRQLSALAKKEEEA